MTCVCVHKSVLMFVSVYIYCFIIVIIVVFFSSLSPLHCIALHGAACPYYHAEAKSCSRVALSFICRLSSTTKDDNFVPKTPGLLFTEAILVSAYSQFNRNRALPRSKCSFQCRFGDPWLWQKQREARVYQYSRGIIFYCLYANEHQWNYVQVLWQGDDNRSFAFFH